MGERRYLTDEYRGKLADLVEDNPGISQQDVEERFVQKCKELSQFVKEGTPVSAIRRLSFSIIESEL